MANWANRPKKFWFLFAPLYYFNRVALVYWWLAVYHFLLRRLGSDIVVPRVRIELTTRRSSGVCSTTELPGLNYFKIGPMVPKRGLEPPRDCSHSHLKAARLPVPPPGPINFNLLAPKIYTIIYLFTKKIQPYVVLFYNFPATFGGFAEFAKHGKSGSPFVSPAA